MIIWGGIAPASPDYYTNTGGKYDPSTEGGRLRVSRMRPLLERFTQRYGLAVKSSYGADI